MTETALGLCFVVEIDEERSLGAWTKCEGLNVEWDLHEYKEGGTNDYVHRLPGRAKYQNLKLTRPLTTATTDVYNWLQQVSPTQDWPNARVSVRDAAGAEVAAWTFFSIRPVKWQGPTLDVGQNQVAIEVLELAHNGFALRSGAPKPGVWVPATLEVVEGKVSTDSVLDLDFKPGEYSISKSSNWTRPQMKGGKQTGKPEFQGANAQTLQFEALFDARKRKDGPTVADAIATLLEWVKPTDDSVAKKKPQPPIVMFMWGENPALTGFRGYLKQVQAKFLLFDGTGKPQRATANITLEEVPIPPSKQNPTSGAIHGRRSYQIRDGDSLASVAWREYEEPALWRGIAAFNDIDDPLRVRSGTTILLPTADEARRLT